jgi:hypothetical protein
MDLQTLFKRESVGDPFSTGIIKYLFHLSYFNGGVPYVPYQDRKRAVWKTGSKTIVRLKMAVW